MDKEFIPYEQAVDLESIGFDVRPNFGGNTSLYSKNGNHTFYTNYGVMGSGLYDGYIYAPTFSQAFRWFREKHEIHTRINPHSSNDGNDNYIVDEYDWEMVHPKYFDGPYFEKYEDAELDCLKKLIEIVNNKDNE